ncbi:hypothetical protein [Streptomyces sp. NPDC058695]|uniref:hypothetical protein n=1 Tax=Streptomyces sp. NPDC058695 TaxID=3346604 RepID=UPI0036460540
MMTRPERMGDLPAIRQQMTWTWSATWYAQDLTRDAVADAYEAWGLTLHTAGMAGAVGSPRQQAAAHCVVLRPAALNGGRSVSRCPTFV